MDFNSTEQSISWFRDRNLEGSLSLKPPYQRNPVWAARQKCFLVESVLKGFPIPEVFVNQVTAEDGATEYAVVDGQQRIRTLLQFVGADSIEGQIEYDKFTLDKLPTDSKWYGLSFADLQADEKRHFYRYKLSVRSLESEDEAEMKEMFRRLNRFTAPLKPQELRNATYAGPFAQMASLYADRYADYLSENRIISSAAIRRMADIEFLAELIIATLHGPQGGEPSTIDSYYSQLEDAEDEFPRERMVRRVLPKTLDAIELILPDLRDTRWGNKTDFYSLYTAMTMVFQGSVLNQVQVDSVRAMLIRLGEEIDARIEDDEANVSKPAVDYARNVVKGANGKARRAGRNAAMLGAFELADIPRFTAKAGSH